MAIENTPFSLLNKALTAATVAVAAVNAPLEKPYSEELLLNAPFVECLSVFGGVL